MMKNTKMMRAAALVMLIVFMLTFAACGSKPAIGETQAQTATTEETKATDAEQTATTADKQASTQTAADSAPAGNTVLVVYFSATGTTKGVAEQIASVTGADTYEILAAQTYTADDLNWHDQNSRTTLEQNDKSVRPAIGSETISLDGYSTIYIGYPIWWGEEPRIMDTFVESYDFSGTTVIPFCTSGGSGIGASGANLAANAGSGNWLEGARLSSSSDIAGWIEGME